MSGWTFDERFKAWAEREAMPLVTANNTPEVVTSKHMEAAFLGGISSRDTDAQTAELAEAIELLEDAMHQVCYQADESPLHPIPGQPTTSDWLDTGAILSWQEVGDWLTQHANWERHPSGVGRRQFYRPPAEEKEA